jgi:hypothetical protein
MGENVVDVRMEPEYGDRCVHEVTEIKVEDGTGRIAENAGR